MPDGPVVALIVLAVGIVLAGGYFLVDHRRHAQRGPKRHVRTAERLPLFGAAQLATRDSHGALHVGDEEEFDRPVAPAPRTTTTARPAAPPPPAPPQPSYAGGGATVPPPARPAPAPRPAAPEPPSAPPAGRPAFTPPLRPAFAGATAGSSVVGSPERADADRDRSSAFAARPAAPAARPSSLPAPSEEALLNGETLRFALPDEGTLRFLPGRLEVVSGADSGREIRFVAPPGSGEPAEVTFGRNEGPAYRHVQLLARTVSRRHAVMVLSDDHWSLRNLSATNPVVLNGRALAPDELAPLLVDGDRIEMGEVTFTFHSR